ncbi:DUF4179 domain-containing protein [Paenibacillus sp. GYB003]|uniref:DUF4179 domain-containing protein n=1 Tax=Paenibacillus sp. GYB003 TaxID=2994392 RepID=UPI002F96CDDE
MSRSRKPDEQLFDLIRGNRPKLPDFETMWERIERQVAVKGDASHRMRRSSRTRKRRILPIVVAASLLLAATPVVAGYSFEWSDVLGRIGIRTAMEQGFGQRIDQTISSEGTTMQLYGAVADDKRLNVLFTLDVPGLPSDGILEFERSTLQYESGEQIPLLGIFRRDEQDIGKLRGFFEANYGAGGKKQQLKLDVSNLIVYGYRHSALDWKPDQLDKASADFPQQPFSRIEIESVMSKDDIVTIKYRIRASGKESVRSDPHLTLHSGKETVKPTYSAVLPSERDDTIVQQTTYRIAPEEWSRISFGFAFLEKTRVIPGHWVASFEFDGRKAAQATYIRRLEADKAVNDSDMELRRLVVTPMSIRLYFDDKWKKQAGTSTVHYENAYLELGGHRIRGYLQAKQNGDRYLEFESPEWYKDWSKVPMKLMLSDAKIGVLAAKDEFIQLTNPSEHPQTVQTTLSGLPVSFTYFKKDGKLVVQSESPSPSFGGITQSFLQVNGGRAYPEMNPTPPGGNGFNRKVETYKNVPDGDLLLNPNSYVLLEPERSEQVQLQE